MTAFFEDEARTPAALSYIRKAVIGGETPYVYVTRRTYDRSDRTVTLTCMGGPEYPFHDPVYARDAPFPGPLLQAMYDEVIRQLRPCAPPTVGGGEISTPSTRLGVPGLSWRSALDLADVSAA